MNALQSVFTYLLLKARGRVNESILRYVLRHVLGHILGH